MWRKPVGLTSKLRSEAAREEQDDESGSSSHIPSVPTHWFWSFSVKRRPLTLLILPTTLPDLLLMERELAGGGLPALPPRLPGGLAGIHRAACHNVDARRTNVRLRSGFKRETCVWAQAEVMKWRGHADALSSSPQIRTPAAQIRMSSILWIWML